MDMQHQGAQERAPGVGREVGRRVAPSGAETPSWLPGKAVLVLPEKTGAVCGEPNADWPAALNRGIGAEASALEVTAVCMTAGHTLKPCSDLRTHVQYISQAVT